MIRYLKACVLVLLAFVLMACGGGGNPSSGNGTVITPVITTTSPTLKLTLVDAADITLTTNSISKSANYYAKALITDSSGAAIANALVNFSTDYTIATLAGSAAATTALTDNSGVAKVKINPPALTTSGAASLTAAAYINGTSATSTLNFSTSASNVSLTNMTASPNNIAALGTSLVSVVGLVNGVASSGVVVNFNSGSCGSFSPSSTTTDGSGLATSTYQSLSNCGGTPVIVTASATGATDITKTISIAAARATNILFDSLTPLTGKIFVFNASSGVKSAVLKFRVVDSTGVTGLASRAVSFSLSNNAIAAGVTFSSSATSGVPTDNSGYVSIAIASGNVPVGVVVTATLDSDNTVSASSNNLAITTGVPTQLSADISASVHSLEALTNSGLSTILRFSVQDRFGNDVPDNTVVSFRASAGVVTGGSCVLTNSVCRVTYVAQGTPPNNGRAVILAYLDGEESFVDSNGDGLYTSGEPFFDTGEAYMDTDGSYTYNIGDILVPGGTTGSAACADFVNSYPSVSNTCDGVWSSNIKVRKQIIITWASSTSSISLIGSRAASGFQVKVKDSQNSTTDNAMPSGTTVAAAITSPASPVCTISSVVQNVVASGAVGGTVHAINLSGASDCTTVMVTVTVTTPKGSVTTQAF